jgi:lysyl-tRNA synthetase, class II
LGVGLALVWLARALAERRRRAWQLAVLLAATSVGAHVIHGLDVEEATFGVILLALLIRYRARFNVPGPRDITAPLLSSVAGLVAAAAFLAWADQLETPPPGVVTQVVQVTAVLLAARAFSLWLRPLGERVLQGAEERRAAHRIVESDGRDSLSYFALRQDKSYHFSASGRTFLAFRVLGSIALVSGDPIGDPGEVEQLVRDFQRMARTRGWRVAILGASAQHMPQYRQLGLRSIRLGEEAIICPKTFSLDGRPIRKVRQSVTRLRREGFAIRFARASDLTVDERAQLETISREWLGRWPERGFTMAMDCLFRHSQTHFALATDADGRIGGFLHLVPSPASGSVSLSAMRRRSDVPNGLMEFLIVETIAWARERNAPEVSLNFCVLTHAMGDQKGAIRAILRFGLRRLDGVFQLERLLRFNRKFFPEWRARYVLVERLTDVPLVGLAFLRVEQLLTLPTSRGRRRNAPAEST